MSSVSSPSHDRWRRGRSLAWIGLVFFSSLTWFGFGLDSEALFVDEAAFLSQSYYGDLFLTGSWDSPLWLEYPGYDLPPLPKYLINASLRVNGLPRPGREWMIRWYQRTNERRFVTPQNLRAARLPSILMGSIGCVALMLIGTITANRRVGVVAAILLAINPLYMLHARRAMADVPAEAFVLLTILTGVHLIRRLIIPPHTLRRVFWISTLVGLFGGLAVLAKLNGGLGLMVVFACIGALMLCQDRSRWRFVWPRSVFALITIGCTSASVFIMLNPFTIAHPPSAGSVRLMAPKSFRESILTRLAEVVEHRAIVSINAQDQFPNDALRSLPAKLLALGVQGFGRFGPFGPRHADSTKRFDPSQDWGAVIWLPLVLAGYIRFCRIGHVSPGKDDVAINWVVPITYLVTLTTVGLFLPLAWDRYFLPIQSVSCMLAAASVVDLFDFFQKRETLR